MGKGAACSETEEKERPLWGAVVDSVWAGKSAGKCRWRGTKHPVSRHLYLTPQGAYQGFRSCCGTLIGE